MPSRCAKISAPSRSIGPNADDTEVLLGNYNGTPSKPVTPLAGIRAKVGSSANVLYARGCDIAEGMVSYEPVPDTVFSTTSNGQRRSGVTVEFFSNLQHEGKPVRTEVSPNIKAAWGNDAPYPELADNQFSVRWSGRITVNETGEYALRAAGGFGRLTFDGKQLGGRGAMTPQFVTTRSREILPGHGRNGGPVWRNECGIAVVSCAGAITRLKQLLPQKRPTWPCCFWAFRRVSKAKKCPYRCKDSPEATVLSIDLPKVQEDLLRAVAATGTPTVLVLLNGSAVAVNWADANIPAILEAWYPGQAAGTAIADVLFGDYNPAGRLPVTILQVG